MTHDENPPSAVAIPTGGHRTPRRWGWLEPVVIVLLSLILNLAGNGRTGLWDRDEPRFAVCVREMRARGDWLFPTFNGAPRYHKPILIYWLMGLGTALGGDNPWGMRLVSAGAGAGSVLGVWLLGRAILGLRGARLAALILATAPIAVAESKLATTDATLALWLLGCQGCLWVLGQRASRMAAALFWLFLSLATLTKGPVGPALIAASSLLAWWWGWPMVLVCKRLHWRIGLAGFAIATAPWFIVVSIATKGEFLRFAVGRQIINRITQDVEAHGGFPGYYPVVSLLAFYPWSALMPAAIVGAWRHRKSDSNLGFLLGAVIGPLVLLECSRTKLIHYYLPAIPACALLTAWLVSHVASEGVNIRRWPLGRLAIALLVGIGLGGIVLLVATAPIVDRQFTAPVLVLAVALAAGTLAGASSLQQGATERAAYALAATWAVVLFLTTAWLIPLAEPYRSSRVLGEKLAWLSAKLEIEPVLLDYKEPGVVYAFGHPIATSGDADEFFTKIARGRSVLTVARPSEVELWRSYYGLSVTPVDQVEGYILAKGKKQTFQLAVVCERDRTTAPADLDSSTRQIGLGIEKSLVK